jgi:hypothetical protein
MPRMDALRQRISLTDAELETLRRVHNGEGEVPDTERAALVRAGLVGEDGRADGLVLDLVETVTGPMIEGFVEASGPQGSTLAKLAVRGETVWYTDPWPGDDDAGPTTYCREELPQLLWILARLTGLRRHHVPAAAKEFTVPLRSVDAVLQTMALGEEHWEPARTVATARLDELFTEVGPQDRVMLMATLSHLEAAVRVTLAWGPERTDARGIALWNCGDGGYWERVSPAEPLTSDQITPTTRATFRPLSAGQVWERFGALLPSKAELHGVAAR